MTTSIHGGSTVLPLGNVETTALIPVAIKASETLRPNARIRDEAAVRIIKTLGVDTRPFDKFMSHEGVIARTVMLDRMVKNYVHHEPNAVVVNLGAGFDNRFERVDNGTIDWFDIDLPDSIAARQKVFAPRERVTMIAADVCADTWVAQVQAAVSRRKSVPLFLAEGLLMYFTMEEISRFLSILKNSFTHGTLFAEQNSPLLVKRQKYHDTVKHTKAVFKSGTTSGQELCALCSGIRFVEEHSFHEEMKKHSLRGKFFAALFPSMNNRWATFEW